MPEKVTVQRLQQMKREGKKIAGMVAWDYAMAQIVDRAGIDIISVGDTVGVNLWGHESPLQVTLDEMILVAKAVRRGAERALVSCDFPFGPLQEGLSTAVRAAIRIVKETGVDVVKLDGAAEYPETVEAIVRAGIAVFAQFGMTPQSAQRYGLDYATLSKGTGSVPPEMTAALVAQAKRLEAAGAALLDITNAGPVAGAAVVAATSLPVIGGFGGGPWLDGRMRMSYVATGYLPKALDDKPENYYAQISRQALEAIQGYAEDVRAGRHVRGQVPKGAAS